MARRELAIVKEGTKPADMKEPIATGPFKYVSFTPGQRSLFTRNENYFIEGKPYLDELEIISIDDSAARLNALLAGQVDAVDVLDFAQAKSLEGNDAVVLIVGDAPSGTQIAMRVDQEPFKDKRVRQALRLLIDRPRTLEIAQLGFGSLGNDLFGKGYPSYNDQLPQREYDPEKAKALLKAAGAEGLALELVTSKALAGMVETAQAFEEQAKAGGAQIKLKQVSPSDIYNQDVGYLKWPFSTTSWPHSFELQAQLGLLKNSIFNETHWDRPAWEARFREAQGIADEQSRNEIFFELQEVLWNEGGYIVWGFQPFLDATSAKVHGIVGHPNFALGSYNLKEAWLTE
jgi:peptide/nickel transport system substrate-binding protein